MIHISEAKQTEPAPRVSTAEVKAMISDGHTKVKSRG